MKAYNMPFDTLKFANRMKAAGMEPKLAEEQAEAISEAMYDSLEAKLDNLVTKDFLKAEMASLRGEFKEDIANLRGEFKEDIANLRDELKGDIGNLKENFTSLKIEMERIEKRLGRLVVGTFSALTIIMGLMQHFHI